MCGRFELKTKFEKLPKVLKKDYPLGLGGVYVLRSSFHDDDDGDDDGEKYIYNFEQTILAR